MFSLCHFVLQIFALSEISNEVITIIRPKLIHFRYKILEGHWNILKMNCLFILICVF